MLGGGGGGGPFPAQHNGFVSGDVAALVEDEKASSTFSEIHKESVILLNREVHKRCIKIFIHSLRLIASSQPSRERYVFGGQ